MRGMKKFVCAGLLVTALGFVVPSFAQTDGEAELPPPAEELSGFEDPRTLIRGCMNGTDPSLKNPWEHCGAAIDFIEGFIEENPFAPQQKSAANTLRRIRLQRASIGLELGQYRAAFKDAVLADDPLETTDDDPIRLIKALALAKQGLTGPFDPAFSYLKVASESKILDIRFYAFMFRGDAFTAIGEYGKADESFESARTLLIEQEIGDPARKRADLNLSLGYAALDQGKHKAAFDFFAKTVALFPQEADGYAARGLAHARVGRIQQAVKDYRKAIELAPSYQVTAHYRMGWLLAKQPQSLTDPAEAIDAARTATDGLEKTDAPAWLRADTHHVLAAAYEGAGQIDDAVRQYGMAMNLDAKHRHQYRDTLTEIGRLPKYGKVYDGDMLAAIRICVADEACDMGGDQWCGDVADVPCVLARR